MRTRRQILRGAARVALASALPRPGLAARPVTVGYVSPVTGNLAIFGIVDRFMINALAPLLAAAGIVLEVRDSRSDPQHAASVTNELIDNNISLMLVSSTPDTTNPVSDQCELAGVPCIATYAPWQAWFFNRGGDPQAGFTWTYNFYWGLEDILAVYTGMWNQLSTNKSVGGLFPNDQDGTAWSDPSRGFPPALAAQNFQLVNPGPFPLLTPDFSSQIQAFKAAKTEIITGVMISPDFVTFWRQAVRAGLAPKIVTMGKALAFPETLSALGSTGNNLSTGVSWSPMHPFSSSLTRQTAGQLAAAYTAATGRQWNQALGYAHALFEVALDVIKRATDPTDPNKVLDAVIATNLPTIVGPISWGNGPVRNVCKTPLVGGQWRSTPAGPFKYDVVITEAAAIRDIAVGGEMQLIG
jgi:branched-chain amino acid transport system substrate-binding protein